MKIRSILRSVVFVALCVSSTIQAQEHSPLPDPSDVWMQVDQGAVLLDVRTEREVNSGTLKESIRVPYDELEGRAKELPASKEQSIMVFCASGRRAGKAVQTLRTLGYTNVLNAGGYDKLVAAREGARCLPSDGC